MSMKHESLDLKQMMNNNTDYVDNTENIRSLKHSLLIQSDLKTVESLKIKHSALRKQDENQFIEICKGECRFLYDNYMDIFNKIVKDEIDLKIMTKLLIVLKMIEDGKVDQHKGSVMVGTVLKELYVDSALKRAEHLDKEYEKEKGEEPSAGKNVSWNQYKKFYK